ncbi:enoyl-CoA hydratase/isomerase family protein [Rhodococcus fascians]|nr:enoyl-CoA hydratase/isomerase family protein [Rhodococcus fascians]MBY3998464.1 enoyl-CoA hydratase/isomerase family protein [Rhodococcus fascians]MBY4004541.1 enoyl-CoA hydratase/isomerase family protein [Rhodococcus fascians]MBY4009277.1 enoyl-CoA hydratase/isomerase family protein [Rhodococcus fascians]MBY4019748.1 enoyl-CoA hydratase/isomerase family protein [Rhodococcus fascians]
MNMSTITWNQDPAGIVTLTFDDPAASANTMNAAYVQSMEATLGRLDTDKSTVTGIVLASGKKTFFAGGDLDQLSKAAPDDAAQMTALANTLKSQLRRLETFGVPVVAALGGAALGGGLEIALAAHYRIAVNRRVIVGLPEVTLGLLPGAGGIVRTVRMLGIHTALNSLLLNGSRLNTDAAVELGLIDEVVADAADLIHAAKAWISANPEKNVQPWDRTGFRIPGGDTGSPGFAANLPAVPANLRKHLKGAPLPAPRAILAAAIEGAGLDIESASAIETRYFVQLVTGQVAKNMIKAFFFDMQAIGRGASRPDGFAKFRAAKVGVVGAGMMGAAIAYACARSGIDVVLKDVDVNAARRGKAYAERIEAKALAAGRTNRERVSTTLARITPTVDAADLNGVDLVVEAVFESVDLKHQVFGEIEKYAGPDAVLGSNTSTIPISTLAQGVRRREDFIGIHFFSPADKMPLVEIIAGEDTSPATVAKVFDFAAQIGKTPIVVNDSRGFFTSRVIMTFIDEAIAAVGEGIEPAVIEQAALQAGYPAGPLQLCDELTLTLIRKLREETMDAVTAGGGKWTPRGSERVVDRLVGELGRSGRSTGSGFYDYDNGTRVGLWPHLSAELSDGPTEVPFDDLQERMLFAEALETVRCFDEGVLNTVAEANVGSLLGIGFPTWTGGVVQYINGYPGGLQGFVARATELAARYGRHFQPPDSLVAKAVRGEIYA